MVVVVVAVITAFAVDVADALVAFAGYAADEIAIVVAIDFIAVLRSQDIQERTLGHIRMSILSFPSPFAKRKKKGSGMYNETVLLPT